MLVCVCIVAEFGKYFFSFSSFIFFCLFLAVVAQLSCSLAVHSRYLNFVARIMRYCSVLIKIAQRTKKMYARPFIFVFYSQTHEVKLSL